jgi:tRNA pseudouridine38-40 synthase
MKPTRHHFLVRFSYYRGAFHGVQEQPGLKTVLGCIRTRIEHAAHTKARSLTCAARTDKGVSALVNYASFYLDGPVDSRFVADVARARDDGLMSVVVRVSKNIHARGNVSLKTYTYTIKDESAFTDDKSGFFWAIAPKLTLAAMQFAALDFLGEQDFSSVRGGGCQAGSTIKHITSIKISRNSGGYILIEIKGYGFLRNMVRNIVGLLVEVGAHLRSFDAIGAILAQKNRPAAGIMAPAHGLILRDIILNKKVS